MEYSVEELGKLKRKISVEVPFNDVKSTYDQVFAQIKGHIRVNGFRPGKFPRQMAEKRFQNLMREEATRSLLPKYFGEVVEKMNVRPATQPNFTKLEIDQKAPFKFEAEFEVIPAFDLPKAKSFKLEKKEPKVTKAQVDQRIEEMRRARATPEDKGQQAAAEGDVVTVDYHGKIGGEDFQGNTASDHPVELGAGRFLPDFEKPLVGAKAGETKTFDVGFPEDYDPSVAGQTAQFEAVVKKVEKKVPPALDAAFFSQFGELPDLSAFREYVETQLREEKAREIKNGYHEQIAEQIKKQSTFEVPEAMLAEHLAEFEHRLGHNDPKVLEDEKQLAKLKKEEAKVIADSIRLNYVIDDWAREEKIEVDQEEVRQGFVMQAYMMRQSPEQLLKSSYGEQLMFRVHQQLLTTRVLDNIVEQVLGEKAGGAGAAKTAVAKTAVAKTGAVETAAGKGQPGAGDAAKTGAGKGQPGAGDAAKKSRAKPGAAPSGEAAPATPPNQTPEENPEG